MLRATIAAQFQKEASSCYKQLDEADKERVKKLSGILRVADGLDRSHYQNVRAMDFEKNGQNGYYQNKYRSRSAARNLGRNAKKPAFEKVTGKKLLIKEADMLNPVPI
jgi:exopolyphosphatase / guanosine-5'-triphosphate,3'-diphosphate pyrophosphatase